MPYKMWSKNNCHWIKYLLALLIGFGLINTSYGE